MPLINVVDTGAIVRHSNFFHPDKEYYCPSSVLSEVRDKRGCEHLEVVQQFLKVAEPSDDDIAYTKSIARVTGDLSVLSATDISVIALAVRYQKEQEEPLRTAAEARQIFQVSAEAVVARKPVPRKEVSVEQIAGASYEDDDGEGAWITSENLSQSLGPQIKDSDLGELDSDVVVTCITGDFAMQNVLMLMGVAVATPTGKRIRKIRQQTLFCTSCRTVSKKTDTQWCGSCGNKTMRKVPIVTNEDGSRVALITSGKPRLRNTIYRQSIPTGGKHQDRNKIYTEDMLFMGGRDRERRHQEKLKAKAAQYNSFDQWGTEDSFSRRPEIHRRH